MGEKPAIEAKVVKLLDAANDLQEKLSAIYTEIGLLLTGGDGMGVKLRSWEQAWDVLWCARYAPGEEHRYVWQYARDRAQSKRLLRTLPLEELEARARRFLGDDDPFYVRARHSFSVFVASINAHAAPSAAPSQAPADCHHTPRCRSDQQHTARRQRELRT
jgi:hypothetical protein